MDNQELKILLIEDNPGDARLIREMLAEVTGRSYNLKHCDRLSTGLACLAGGDFDVVLLDLGLPDSEGFETLNRVCALALTVPVVVLTVLGDEEVGVKAVQSGAQRDEDS